MVHMNTACSGLTNKQLTALRATENLEWTCQDCHLNSPKRRSVIIPSEDEEEDIATALSSAGPGMQINVKQLLDDISKGVEKAIQKEMKEINHSLQFNSEKMEELIETMEACKQSIQDLKRKNTELSNKNNYLETRVGALEQRLQEMEQQKLSKHIEISNIPFTEEENIQEIVQNVATKLNLPISDIEKSRRLPGRKDRPGNIQIIVKEEPMQQKWLETSKKIKLCVKDVSTNTKDNTINDKVFIREALTTYNKKLLWYTKQELKDTYKYIWCKKGTIMVRRQDNDKLIKIRSEEDVQKLALPPTRKQ